jgi:hypothetical protein
LTDTVLSWKPQALPEPWIIVPTNMRASLEAELRAEMAPGHVLSSSQILTAVARCQGCDDVVFSAEGDHPIRFALVHLTWRRHPERLPWPTTELVALPLSDSLRWHTHAP